MILSLMDYEDNKHDFEIGDLKDINKINIDVVTGDEVAIVEYKDNCIRYFDSDINHTRRECYHDREYVLYTDTDIKGNEIKMNLFLKRKSSYDMENLI